MKIPNHRTAETIFDAPNVRTMRKAVMLALKGGADLRWADLRGADLNWADLRWADLRGADLRWADLSGANLTEADLSGANLSGANLRWADLSRANLTEADLTEADLRGADLRWADLSDADLNWADLSDADLSDADLRGAKDDFFAVLSSTAHEVAGLRAALIDGRINGQAYEGECACLVGTIANIRHCAYNTMPDLHPNSSRPIERLFLSIRPGDTPATNPISAIVVGWMDEWMTGQASGR